VNIDVNGVNLFYEKSGSGSPIILLHGNSEDHSIFDVLVPQLSATHTVYAIDSRDHGKSDKVSTLEYHAMMEDTAEFIQKLDIQSPALFGFSDGGIIGILLAAKYPQMLSKLIIAGANTNPNGIKPLTLAAMKAVYFFTRSQQFKMMLTKPNIPNAELQKIETPTLVLAGSKDLIREQHTRMIAENIKNSTLKILDGEDHTSYVLHSKKLYGIINPFLTGK